MTAPGRFTATQRQQLAGMLGQARKHQGYALTNLRSLAEPNSTDDELVKALHDLIARRAVVVITEQVWEMVSADRPKIDVTRWFASHATLPPRDAYSGRGNDALRVARDAELATIREFQNRPWGL